MLDREYRLRQMPKEFVKNVVSITKQSAFLFVQGNQDRILDDFWWKMDGVHCLNNQLVFIDGLPFIGYSGINNKKRFNSLSQEIMVFFDDKSLKRNIEHLLAQTNLPPVLVTHAPPLGVLDYSLGHGHFGSKALKHLVWDNNFLLHLFGHSHFWGGCDCQFEGTRCVNVASREDYSGAARIVTVEIDKGSIVQISRHAIPVSNTRRLFTLHNISKSRNVMSLEQATAHFMNESREEQINVEYEFSVRGVRGVIQALYKDKIKLSSAMAHEIARLEQEGEGERLYQFIRAECIPWPIGLTPRVLLDIFYAQFSLRDEPFDYTRFFEVVSNRGRTGAKRYIMNRLAKDTGKYVVDVLIQTKIPSIVSSFTAKWIPHRNKVIAGTMCSSENIKTVKGGATLAATKKVILKNLKGALVVYGTCIADTFDFDDAINLGVLATRSIGSPDGKRSISDLDRMFSTLPESERCYESRYIRPSDDKLMISLTSMYLECADREFLVNYLGECCRNEALLLNFFCRIFSHLESLPKEHFILCKFDDKKRKVILHDR